MYYKVVNGFDADMLLKAAEEEFVVDLKNESVAYRERAKLAIQSLREQVVRLDLYYDERRRADTDLGGYAYFLPTCEDVERFLKLIKEWHHITELPSEFTDVVAETEAVEFVEELFLPSSDFAIVCTYPRRKAV